MTDLNAIDIGDRVTSSRGPGIRDSPIAGSVSSARTIPPSGSRTATPRRLIPSATRPAARPRSGVEAVPPAARGRGYGTPTPSIGSVGR